MFVSKKHINDLAQQQPKLLTDHIAMQIKQMIDNNDISLEMVSQATAKQIKLFYDKYQG